MDATNPDEYDFGSPELQACPHEFYRLLRESAPVYKIPGREAFILSRHADVQHALRTPAEFSSRRRPTGGSDPEIAAIRAQGHQLVPTLTNNDPPSHTKYRKLISGAFTPRATAGREASIRELTNLVIDDFVDDGRVDFVSQFAARLPVYVLADSLGQPRELGDQMRDWAKAVNQSVNPMIPRDQAIEYQRTIIEFLDYFAGEVERARAHPKDDFLTQLATAETDGELLSMEEVLDLLRVFITGGNETMTSLLSGMMFHLLRTGQYNEVVADRSLLPAAVEESLRYEGSAHWFPRMVERDDVEIGGVHIPPGSQVVIALASANRDDAVFPDADEFDIHRRTSGHLGFRFRDPCLCGRAARPPPGARRIRRDLHPSPRHRARRRSFRGAVRARAHGPPDPSATADLHPCLTTIWLETRPPKQPPR